MSKLSKALIVFLFLWQVIFLALLTIASLSTGEAISWAMIVMIWGLVLLWIGLSGGLFYVFRDKIRQRVLNWSMNWRVRFVLMATFLALWEEAITVSMTNLAPVLGVPIGTAYITASANYFDVVLLHSVVVFVPMFIAWAWLLGKYDFSPVQVLILFGITGTLAESLSFGLQNFINLGMWIFVYGLMVYLPAYCLPPRDKLEKPQWNHFLMAVFLPILAAIPVAVFIGILHPVAIHFASNP